MDVEVREWLGLGNSEDARWRLKQKSTELENTHNITISSTLVNINRHTGNR